MVCDVTADNGSKPAGSCPIDDTWNVVIAALSRSNAKSSVTSFPSFTTLLSAPNEVAAPFKSLTAPVLFSVRIKSKK